MLQQQSISLFHVSHVPQLEASRRSGSSAAVHPVQVKSAAGSRKRA